MKKLLLTLLLGTIINFTGCDPKILDPNTNQKVTRDSTYTHLDSTKDTIRIPVSRNDLGMFMRIDKAKLKDTLEYTAILQVLGDTITVNNGKKVGDERAIKYKIFRNNLFYNSREDNSNAIISLFDNGFIKQQTKRDSIEGTITNAKVWARIYNRKTHQHDTINTTIPSPITVMWKERRNHVENEIVKENGLYHIEAEIKYSMKDTNYTSTFTTNPFQVGGTTGVRFPKRGSYLEIGKLERMIRK